MMTIILIAKIVGGIIVWALAAFLVTGLFSTSSRCSREEEAAELRNRFREIKGGT